MHFETWSTTITKLFLPYYIPDSSIPFNAGSTIWPDSAIFFQAGFVSSSVDAATIPIEAINSTRF